MILQLVLFLALQQPASSGSYTLAFPVPDLGPMRYALTLPRGYKPGEARPLILALHPGGPRVPGHGGSFVQQVVGPGLGGLGAIIVAPDIPTRSWTDPIAERATLALLGSVMDDYAIDRSRVLVTGYSLGGRGAWFMASRHPDLFTGAIVMAGFTGDEPVDRLATVPTYVIHSRDDEVAPFGPTERAVRELRRLKRDVEFEPLDGATHFQMGSYIDSLQRAGRWIAGRWNRVSVQR